MMAENEDEKDPIGRVKSISQESKYIAGMKSSSKPEGVEVILNEEQGPLAKRYE